MFLSCLKKIKIQFPTKKLKFSDIGWRVFFLNEKKNDLFMYSLVLVIWALYVVVQFQMQRKKAHIPTGPNED